MAKVQSPMSGKHRTLNAERRTSNAEVGSTGQSPMAEYGALRQQCPTVPLRVDFAGGWLDVPRFARAGGCVVNCAIMPGVSLEHWPYHRNAGLGGSAAWAQLQGEDAVASDLVHGAGWQDPAVIRETGLCVWRSGPLPVLEIKTRGEFLQGRMGLLWMGSEHDTAKLADRERDWAAIEKAGAWGQRAVWQNDFHVLMAAVALSYELQLREGMVRLKEIPGAVGWKYCGSGHGGYALYLFDDPAARDASGLVRIEPFIH